MPARSRSGRHRAPPAAAAAPADPTPCPTSRGRLRSSPGNDGTNGREPAAMTMVRVVRVSVPLSPCTSTVHGESAWPCPDARPHPAGGALRRVVRLDRLDDAVRGPSRPRSRTRPGSAMPQSRACDLGEQLRRCAAAPCWARSRCSGSRRPCGVFRLAPPWPWWRPRCRAPQTRGAGADDYHVVGPASGGGPSKACRHAAR